MQRLLERDQLRAIMDDARKALAEVAKKHGMTKLEPGPATFDSYSGSFHCKVEGVVKGGLSAEQHAYEMSRSFDKDMPALGSYFKDPKGALHKVVGANKNGKPLTECKGKVLVWRDRQGFKTMAINGAVK